MLYARQTYAEKEKYHWNMTENDVSKPVLAPVNMQYDHFIRRRIW